MHRVAHQHRQALVGRAFQARSPNGRFADGAALIDGRPLRRVEAIGKNLFYFFGGGEGEGAAATVMHVHFGMSGRFGTFSLAKAPEPKPTTRLVLTNEADDITAHLSAMTVQHGGMELFEGKRAGLGEDPLRDDADKEILWAKCASSKKPVGLLPMDQSMMAGTGNIYRAEILWRTKLHPEIPCCELTREQFDELWRHSVKMLRKGFQCGSIITTDDECGHFGAPWTRRYIYNQSHCPVCKGKVRSWTMASRTVYACEVCQPLAASTRQALPDARKQALTAAGDAKLFASGCARDSGADLTPAKMKVAQLRAALQDKGLDTSGKKAQLVARLLAAEGAGATEGAAVPITGTADLKPRSAADAAADKVAAGEGRNVEHIAELDDSMVAVLEGASRASVAKLVKTPRPHGKGKARGSSGDVAGGSKRARRSL